MSPPNNLLRFDARSLDDRPPLRDVGFLHRGERLGRLLLARRKDKPWSTSFWRMAGSCVVPTAAALSLSIMSLGVPLGANRPAHSENWNQGNPTSSADGISGAIATRSLVVTANALTLPARTCGIAVAVLEIVMSICPAIRSCTDGLTPR